MTLKNFLKAMICSLGFAGTYVFGKLISGCAPALCLGFGRFLIATICFLPFVKFEKLKKTTFYDWCILAGAGFIGITCYNYLFYTAALYTTSINISLINATIPIITLLVTSVLTRTMPTSNQIVAFGSCLCGVFLIITNGKLSFDVFFRTPGELIMLVGALSWVIYGLMIQDVAKKISPLVVTFCTGFFGMIFLFLMGMGSVKPLLNLGLSQWLSLFYIGAIGTAISYYLYVDTIKEIGPRLTTFIIFSTTPLFVSILAYLILGTVITSWQIVGGMLVACGLFLNFKR